jgi:glucan phosphoethanolaminetransferase (alkaline phosphatase superfamily)
MHDEDSPVAVRLLVLAPLAFLAGYATVRVGAPDLVPRLIKEDGALEYLQVLLYATAACFSLLVAVRSHSSLFRWVFAVFGLACALVALEEMSWGERLLGFDPPESIRDLNTQGEMNLHNLAPVQRFLHLAYILAGLVAGLGWRVAAGLPDGRLRRYLGAILPDWYSVLFFLPVAVFYAYMEIIGFPTIGWLRSQDQEVFETLFAGGCVVFTWTRLQRSYSGW